MQATGRKWQGKLKKVAMKSVIKVIMSDFIMCSPNADPALKSSKRGLNVHSSELRSLGSSRTDQGRSKKTKHAGAM